MPSGLAGESVPGFAAMGLGVIPTTDLDRFVKECDESGLLATARGRERLAGFQLSHSARVDQSLDPFSEEYFQQQVGLYREISGRELDQGTGEQTPIDVEAHAMAANPYNQARIGHIARHVRAIQGSLMAANLPAGAAILDMGCGWGLSSETMAYSGAMVTAVDINPRFVELIQRRAVRLGLPIEAVVSNFDSYTDSRRYDLVFFYECLHHSLRPWETLARMVKLLKPGGRIMWAGEPVNRSWWRHWGLRLDPESVYVMRKYGWWEGGWSLGFLTRCFERCGMSLQVIGGIGLDGGPVGFAVRAEEAGQVFPDLSVAGSFRSRLHASMQSWPWWLASGVQAAGKWARGLGIHTARAG